MKKKNKWHQIKRLPKIKKMHGEVVEQEGVPVQVSEEDVEKAFKRIGVTPENIKHWS